MLKESGIDTINNMGVTNHLTPVDNIITNVRNFFSSQLSLVVTKGEDNVSIKCTSSLWEDEESARSAIHYPTWNGRTSLYAYISMQGLQLMKTFIIGQEVYVYFCPNDMPNVTGYGSGDNDCLNCKSFACKEQKIYNIGDLEFDTFNEDNNWQGDQEIEGIQKKDIRELLSSTDKVKAAKAFAEILGQNMRMPENYYIKAVRDEYGNESVALRYRYEKRKPFGKTATVTKTLVNIYGLGDNGIWVDGADDPNGLPEEMKGVIDDMLGFIGVRRTSDACCFTIAEDPDTADDLKSEDPMKSQEDENMDKKDNKDDNVQDQQQKDKDENGQSIGNDRTNENPNKVAGDQADNSLNNSGFSRNDGMFM